MDKPHLNNIRERLDIGTLKGDVEIRNEIVAGSKYDCVMIWIESECFGPPMLEREKKMKYL